MITKLITKLFNLKRRYILAKFHKIIPNTLSFNLEESDDLTISVLCGHNSVDMALAMLKSLYRFLSKKYPIEIHDDGSLTTKDCERIGKSFKGIRIILRKEADDYMLKKLTDLNLVKVLEFRKKNNINLQLTDLSSFCKTKYCLQIDTDILFFSKPYFLDDFFLTGLIKKEPKSSLYNLDRGRAYAYRDEDIKMVIDEMPLQFNAGLVIYPVDDKLLVEVNSILEKRLVSLDSHTESQTLQAIALNKIGICYPMNETVDVVFRTLEMNNKYNMTDYSKLTSQHYCSWARNLYYLDYIEKIHPFIKKDSPYRTYFHNMIKSN